jgi:hypothetical protein
MKFGLGSLLLLATLGLFAQEKENDKKLPYPMIENDSLYREDQFYLAFSYNILLNRPSGISQNKFNSGFTGGFLRDFRSIKQGLAIALGLGVSYNKYFHNLVISKKDEVPQYNVITEGVSYQRTNSIRFLSMYP